MESVVGYCEKNVTITVVVDSPRHQGIGTYNESDSRAAAFYNIWSDSPLAMDSWTDPWCSRHTHHRPSHHNTHSLRPFMISMPSVSVFLRIVWHNVPSQQHTYMSSSYRSNRLGLSHWDPYAVRRGGCLDMVEWFWWDSSLLSTINWFPSVLWHCWFGKIVKLAPKWPIMCRVGR